MLWYWVIYESNSSSSSSVSLDEIEEISSMSFFFIIIPLCFLSPLVPPLSLLQRAQCVPPWASSPPPERSCSRAVPQWRVWPAGASPHPGGWTGRWGAAAAPQGCHAAWRSWGRTAATAGAAPSTSLQTSGGRRAQWAVRPVWVDRALSLKAWTLPAAQSRASATLPVWKSCCCFFHTDLHQAAHLLSSHVSAAFTASYSLFQSACCFLILIFCIFFFVFFFQVNLNCIGVKVLICQQCGLNIKLSLNKKMDKMSLCLCIFLIIIENAFFTKISVL